MNEYGVIRDQFTGGVCFMSAWPGNDAMRFSSYQKEAARFTYTDALKGALRATRLNFTGVKVIRFIDTPGEDRIEVVWRDEDAEGWVVQSVSIRPLFAIGMNDGRSIIGGINLGGLYEAQVCASKAEAYGLIERGAITRGATSSPPHKSDYEVVGVVRIKSEPTTTYEVVV